MREAIWKPLPIVAGLLLVLTYLLVKSANPDPVLHESTLHTLHALILDDAALHRDVLKARANLLPNYDPLVRATDGLRGAIDALRIVGEAAHGETDAVIIWLLRELAATVAEQEALIETFKSDNALLQNSLTYFMHASHGPGLQTGDGRQDVTAEVGVLTNAMLRFMREPQSGTAGEVASSLDRLARLPAAQQPLEADIATLVAHGRVIVEMLPKVDGILGQLLAVPTATWGQAVQESYLDHFGRVTARAKIFRVLLYLASLALLAYLSLLFWRLHTSARTLAERSSSLQVRLNFEGLIAGISAQFINLPPTGSMTGSGMRSSGWVSTWRRIASTSSGPTLVKQASMTSSRGAARASMCPSTGSGAFLWPHHPGSLNNSSVTDASMCRALTCSRRHPSSPP